MLNSDRIVGYVIQRGLSSEATVLTGPQRRRMKHKRRTAHAHFAEERCLRCSPPPRHRDEAKAGNPRDWSPPVQ